MANKKNNRKAVKAIRVVTKKTNKVSGTAKRIGSSKSANKKTQSNNNSVQMKLPKRDKNGKFLPKTVKVGKVAIKVLTKANNKSKSAPKKKAALPVEIVCIVDRSGSMSNLHDDVVGGINKFIQEQKQVKGKANLTLVEFDNEYNVIQHRQDLKKVKEVTKDNFIPRGMTALNDAIGKTVKDFAALKEAKKINKAIFCIMTDGGENASVEFKTKAAVKALTEKAQKDYNWEFVYLGANQDAFAEGASYGLSGVTKNFVPTAMGVASATSTLSANTRSYRNSNS